MGRKKIVLEFLAAMSEVDLERVKLLWKTSPYEIVMGLSKRNALNAYNFLGNHGMESERDNFYSLATKNDHSAAQDLIAARYIS